MNEENYQRMRKKVQEYSSNNLQLGRKQFRRGLLLLPLSGIILAQSTLTQSKTGKLAAAFLFTSSTLVIMLGLHNQYKYWREK